MLASQVTIDLRIDVMQIYHAVEGSVQMRIANPQGAFVSFGRVSAVQMYVRVRVIIIG